MYSTSAAQQWAALPEAERLHLVRGQASREVASEMRRKDWDAMSPAEQGLVSRVLEARTLLVRALLGGVVSPDEYPLREVEQSFSHVSHHAGDSAMVCRDAFLESVQAHYDSAIGQVETDAQRQALDGAIGEFTTEYLRREQPVTRARAVSYSGFVAGGSKLNTRQVGQRGNALDRAAETFSAWLRSAQGAAKAAVLAARNPEQLDAEQQKLDDKAARRKASEEAMVRRLLNFKPGDTAKLFGPYPIAKVSFTRDGYPSSVTVEATDLTDNKFDVAKTIFGGDKARLRAVVDAVRSADVSANSLTGANDMTRGKPAVFGFVSATGEIKNEIPAMCMASAMQKMGDHGYATIGELQGRAVIVVRPEAGAIPVQEGVTSFEIDSMVPGMRALIAEYPCKIALEGGPVVAVSATGIIGPETKPRKKAGMSM